MGADDTVAILVLGPVIEDRDERVRFVHPVAVRCNTIIEVVDGSDEGIQITGKKALVATGVKPNSDDIGLDAVGVETEDDGEIRVDEHYQTTNPEIYAAGDIIGEPELETVAAKEGNHAVKNAFDNEGSPSITTPSQRSCSSAPRSPPSARPNTSTWMPTKPAPAGLFRWRTSRARRPSKTPTSSSKW